MEDTYVYISVKLYLKDGQTKESIQEVVQNLDYSFSHDEILGHDIVDILDTQIPSVTNAEILKRAYIEFPVDPFDLPINEQ